MGKVISFGIQKGGCGKTTTTAMLSSVFTRLGYKVLAVDFDSQGNLTKFLTTQNPYDFDDRTVFEACKERDPRPYIYEINERLHILPAHDLLSKLGNWLYTEYYNILRREGNHDRYAPSKLLKETLDVVKDEYDFIMIDLPPNLGEQTINGIAASDYAMVILQAEPFCKDALDNYFDVIEHVVREVNENTRVLGITTALIDERYKMSEYILDEVREDYQELVFNTVINRRKRILEYSFEGIKEKNLTKVDDQAQEMYYSLADEILERIGMK